MKPYKKILYEYKWDVVKDIMKTLQTNLDEFTQILNLCKKIEDPNYRSYHKRKIENVLRGYIVLDF